MSGIKKPSEAENEYFAREDAEKIKKAAAKAEAEERARARLARLGTCPGGCETKLVQHPFQGLVIDRCPTCGGVWLDPGELDEIAKDSANTVRDWFDFFRRKSG